VSVKTTYKLKNIIIEPRAKCIRLMLVEEMCPGLGMYLDVYLSREEINELIEAMKKAMREAEKVVEE